MHFSTDDPTSRKNITLKYFRFKFVTDSAIRGLIIQYARNHKKSGIIDSSQNDLQSMKTRKHGISHMKHFPNQSLRLGLRKLPAYDIRMGARVTDRCLRGNTHRCGGSRVHFVRQSGRLGKKIIDGVKPKI